VVRRRAIGQRPVLRRLLAAAALGAFALAVVVIVAVFLRSLVVLPVVAVGLSVAVLAGWTALVCRGRRRLVALSVGFVAFAATLVVLGAETMVGMVVVFILVAASNAAAGLALAQDPSLVGATLSGRSVGPARKGVLLMNPLSGGGKVDRFGLVEAAQQRGVEAVLLQPGDDLRALAERAVTDGADALGMAGGDGSQALVADVAQAHDVAFVCVPAGTRNHFALDLGLERKDVRAALEAFGDAVERRIDLATVDGRIFVNNASLGAYATIVQSESYRQAKLGTAAALLPDLLGPAAPTFDLRYDGPDGQPQETADLLLVSNNPYALRTLTGLGTRPRLDAGLLGIVAVRAEHIQDVSVLAALESAGAVNRFPGLREWTAQTFRVDSADTIPVGLDGEALRMRPPLEFRTLPGALRVRLPLASPGATHSVVRPPGVRRTVAALIRVVSGRPVSPAWV
jgi:diacylglycerol kinase family enzyme